MLVPEVIAAKKTNCIHMQVPNIFHRISIQILKTIPSQQDVIPNLIVVQSLVDQQEMHQRMQYVVFGNRKRSKLVQR